MAGIYIHIPFCKSKCNYCNFYSVASLKYKDELIDALIKEIELRKDYLQKDEIQTLYFGGGTPSLLNAEDFYYIINKLYKTHNISQNPEITIEVNPDDIDNNKIAEIKHSPVNRISVGVQSLFDEDLKFLSRRHSGRQAENAVFLLQDAGYSNLSVDFIYGIPTLTNVNLKANINAAVSWKVPHISAYSLTVEENTLLKKYIQNGKLPLTNEDESIEHFRIIIQLLNSSGYQHYEISNFCKKGFHSKHNTNYWKDEKYLGIGPGAHSYDKKSRQWNVSNIKQYIESISKGIVPFEREILNESQKYNEYILTGLRTIWGCDTRHVFLTFGDYKYKHLLNEIKIFEQKGMISRNGDILTLTDEGKLFADYITSELFIIEE